MDHGVIIREQVPWELWTSLSAALYVFGRLLTYVVRRRRR